MTHILLTRSAEENELTTQKINDVGFSSISLPMISYIDEKISEDLSDYHHIIVTSKYAAKIVSSYFDRKIECWAIGTESANILSQNPNITVTGIAKNVKELLSIIHMIPEEEATLFFESSIYLSGDIITQELPNFIKRLVIYKVLYTDKVSKHQLDSISNEKIKYILVYSKNCAINLVRLIEKYELFPYFKHSTVVAISEEVSSVFASINIKAIYSTEPVFENMLKLLIEHEQKSLY